MKKNLIPKNSDLEFLGWQKNHLGESFALYNITKKDHPSYGSTISENTINKLHLKMPEQHESEENGHRLGKSSNEIKASE